MRRLAPILIALALLQPAAAAEAFRFVVIGHLRGGPGNGVIPTELLREAVDAINAREPDLVFVTGDIVYGSWHQEPDADAIRADWDAVDAELARLTAPVHRAAGNHDAWDPVTRDIWLERYGPLYRSFDFANSHFTILQTGWVPAVGDDGYCPGYYTRGAPLEEAQLSFLREDLEQSDAEHVFVIGHHMLWWEQADYWWSTVHPLLTQHPVRMVVAGDLGPWKFSHEERDDIDYIQSTVEFTDVPLQMLRNRENSRVISSQPDNYLVVDVDGPDVRYELETLGAFTRGKYNGDLWKDIYTYDEGTVQRKLYRRFNTPERVTRGLLMAAGGGFAAALGLMLAIALVRRLGKRG